MCSKDIPGADLSPSVETKCAGNRSALHAHGESHPVDSMSKHVPQVSRQFQCQACFATASRPDQCDQAHLVEAQE